MRKGRTSGYRPGDNWMMCDHCGMRFRASEMRRQPHGQWQGLWVCPNDYDEYNPQEELRAVPEKIVPDKVNPEPESVLIGEEGAPRVGFIYAFTLGGGDVFGTGYSKITAEDL